MTRAEAGKVDILEHGANQQTSTRRLYMQLQAFGDCDDPKRLALELERARVEGVLYADAADPLGVAVLGIAEDPAFFVGRWREILGSEPFLGLRRKPELTMFGRTYSSGFEADLEDWLLARPRRTALGPDWPWAIWYPSAGPGRSQGSRPRSRARSSRSTPCWAAPTARPTSPTTCASPATASTLTTTTS
jgi:chlorite dismutase